QLLRGERLVEILKQPQYQPLPLEKQVLILYAGAKGFLDKLPINTLAKYEAGLYQFVESRYPDILSGISEKREITDDIDQQLQKALAEYGEEFKDTIK
ncbi:MAG: F0F1 ATP synthase subunit alpha, partial [Desulfobacterales bacterium]|nr:F0F1 ATP synthase subunit alpha [Desulfobacterales bacterium]